MKLTKAKLQEIIKKEINEIRGFPVMSADEMGMNSGKSFEELYGSIMSAITDLQSYAEGPEQTELLKDAHTAVQRVVMAIQASREEPYGAAELPA